MSQSSSSSAPGASLLPDGVGVITTAHLAMIVIVALLAVAIIVIGMRRSARRRQARDEVVEHAHQAGVDEGAATPRKLDDELAQGQHQSQRQVHAPPVPQPSPPVPPAAPARIADHPVAAGSAPEADPGMIAADRRSEADGPVTQLKGLGPKVAARLHELGVTSVGQIAALDDDQAAALDAELGPFSGRLARDRWVEQARFLAAGDRSGFEAVFGKL